MGHNNYLHNIQVEREPKNYGRNNKFRNVEMANGVYQETEENNEEPESNRASSSRSSSNSNAEGYTATRNFELSTDFEGNLRDMMNGLSMQYNIGEHFGEQFQALFDDQFYNDNDSEEEEEKDEEAHISPEERMNIINSLNSFSYNPKDQTEEVKCAVCLSNLVVGQQVKGLPCSHMFHSG